MSRGRTYIVQAGLAFLIVMLGTTLPTPLYPALEQRYGFAELGTTVLFAVYPVGVTMALLGCGHWSDVVGRRPMLFAGLACSAVSAALFLVPGSEAWLFAGRLVSGFSAGIFTGTATATLVDLAEEGGKERAGLVATAANMGGLGLGPLLAGLVAEWAPGPLVTPFVVDLVLLAFAGVAVLTLPETVRRDPHPRLAPQKPHVPAGMRDVFARAAIAGFAGFAVMGLFSAVSPAFLGQVLKVSSPAVVGVVVFSVFFSSVVGQVISGRLPTARGLTLGCVALIAGMLVLGGSLLATSLPMLVVGGVIAGIGQGLALRAGLGSVGEASPPDQRGAISSAFFVALYVGISLPIVGFGLLSTATGLVPAGLVFTTLVGVLALLVLVLLGRVRDRARASA